MVLSGGVTQSAGLTVPVQTNAIEIPVGNNTVNYAPEQNNVAYSYANNPMSFAGLPGLPADVNNAGTILIGRTRYPANSVIASAPQQMYAPPAPYSPAPSQLSQMPAGIGYSGPVPSATGLQSMSPQMDPGTEWNDLKDQLGSGRVPLGASGGSLPARMPTPDMEGQSGIPNPYLERPQAPALNQANLPQFAGPAMNPWIQGQPQIKNYLPDKPAIAPGLKGIVQRLQQATPQWQRGRAAAMAFNKDIGEKQLSGYNMLAQQGIAAQSNLMGEQMSQQGSNYRNENDHFNAGALATLNHMFAMRLKQTMDAGQAIQMAADAFAMPAEVVSPGHEMVESPPGSKRMVPKMVPNMMKVQYLQGAAQVMGWSGDDIYKLARSQDPRAAEALQQLALKTRKDAFDLNHAQERLTTELNKMRADTRAINAGAKTVEFNNRMHGDIEKGLRAQLLANAMEDVTKHWIHKEIAKSEIDAANSGARKAYFDEQKAKMEAAGVPLAAAVKIIEVQQKLLTVAAAAGPNSEAGVQATKLAAELRDSSMAAMGVTTHREMQTRPGQTPDDPRVPILGADGQPTYMNQLNSNISPAAAQMGAMVNQGQGMPSQSQRLYSGWNRR